MSSGLDKSTSMEGVIVVKNGAPTQGITLSLSPPSSGHSSVGPLPYWHNDTVDVSLPRLSRPAPLIDLPDFEVCTQPLSSPYERSLKPPLDADDHNSPPCALT